MSIAASIRKRLGGFSLDVDFSHDGGCLGILGASGSGKSMTLKCLAGIETPDEGRIAVNGRALFDSARGIDLRPQRRRVGYLFQGYALFPRMTAAENIAAGMNAPAAERARRVADLLRRFHLDGLGDRLPDQLSGGQRQRAALARMLAAEPETILMDEPFSALDGHLRETMRLAFREMFRNRSDMILVTHSREEAYALCSSLVVLDGGRILGRGPTREVFGNPGHVRVARITGCKNISRMERTGDREIAAPDWGLRLRTAAPPPDGARFVGVRAHSLVPAGLAEAKGENTVRVRVLECAEEPFEHTVVFVNADAAGDSGGDQTRRMWWKCAKTGGPPPAPEWLRIPPEALLFLRGDDVSG